MKKVLKIIGVVFLCLVILGQFAKIVTQPMMKKSEEISDFKRMIERADRDCPIPAALGKGEVTGIKLENNSLVYYLSYDHDFLNVLGNLKNLEKAKEGIIMCFLCLNGQGQEQGDMLMDLLIKENCGLKVVITESAAGRMEYSATVEEIRTLRENIKLNPHEALYNLLLLGIEAGRISLPIQIDEGMYMTDYQLEADNIVLTITVDEDIYSLENMVQNMDFIKASIIDEALNDPTTKAQFDMCKVSHSELIYRICGNRSCKYFDITITSNEMREIVQTPSNVSIY